MTAIELRAMSGFVEMCQSPQFQELLSHLEQECPFLGHELADPTRLVNNEGKMQGWLGAAKYLRSIHTAPKRPPQNTGVPRQTYPDPEKIEQPKRK